MVVTTHIQGIISKYGLSEFRYHRTNIDTNGATIIEPAGSAIEQD